jgi:hypothetical protein
MQRTNGWELDAGRIHDIEGLFLKCSPADGTRAAHCHDWDFGTVPQAAWLQNYSALRRT